MAWPTAQRVLSSALSEVHGEMIQIKGLALGEIIALGNPTDANKIITIYQRMVIFDRALGRAATVPGLTTHARDQLSGPPFNAVSEITAVRALLQAVIAQIESDILVVGGFLQTHSFTGGEYVARTFTPVQTVNLRVALQALADSVT